mmetsp:Transcript_12323/g.24415  ORF Transcript_12323/g.24415 Transcript_12323/m.24415 type:complete len:204 (+) Transcript_12323:570-1181(+)
MARKVGRSAPSAAGLHVALLSDSGLHSAYWSSIWNCRLVSSTSARVAFPMASVLMPPMNSGVSAPATAHAKRMFSPAVSPSVPPAIRGPRPDSCLKAAMMLKAARIAAAVDQPLDSAAHDSPHMKRETVTSLTAAVSSWLHASSALKVTGAMLLTAITNHASDTKPSDPMATPYWPAMAPHAVIKKRRMKPMGSSEISPTPAP